MKKVLFLALGLMLMVSCSNDAETTSFNQDSSSLQPKSTTATLEDLYDSMIQSQSYKNAESARNAFISKMNFNGTTSDVQTEAKLLFWISSNISRTTFTNYSAAVTEWENVKDLNYIAFEDNRLFFETLKGKDPSAFQDLLNPIEAPYSDECDCEGLLDICGDMAQEEYSSNVSSAVNSLNGTNGDEVSGAVAQAKVIYDLTTDVCADQYLDCVLSCR